MFFESCTNSEGRLHFFNIKSRSGCFRNQYRSSSRTLNIVMAFKLIAFFALVAVASAAVLPNGQLIAEHEAPAHYNFEYQVNDPTTGDEKHQEESREGDAVRGSYSLVEADGTRRIVEYTADDLNGFQAVVHKEPAGAPLPAPSPVVTKVVKPVVAPFHAIAPVATAPLVTKVSALPAYRTYNPYNQYYAGFANPYAVQPYAAYSHPYSPYLNRYNVHHY
ncbi:cuticle protein 7-like [Coccinella septempunctata]|uniref:cuticle protein 7-like n=1 Tax=Coccinella septempunctata TaxID=41139 RepID=UPI001D092FE5|nr:cuticle protein 7-like [Coccinella septempunctata]